MTAHKHLKQLIRARMEKTGERYAAARRQVIGSRETAQPHPHAASHFAGNVPATTALRILLTHAGVRAPHTGAPFTEAMVFGIAGGIGIGVISFYYEKEDFASFYIAGGIGIGVTSFYYEKEDFASFFIAGRHQWQDDLVYLTGALAALAIEPAVHESSGSKTAGRQLAEAVAGDRPCIAWVDMASLPHRGMPDAFKGISYHVITVYAVELEKGTALIGDLTDHPITVSLADLEAARARIKKQRFRLLSIEPGGSPRQNLRALVEDGLRRCHHGLLHPTLPSMRNNARLEALKTWAERLASSADPQGWERVFRPGANLWRGLNFVYVFIESYGTGGGLYRPLFADFLEEAAAAVPWPALNEFAGRYHELGRRWSELADAALPDSVPAFRKAKELRGRIEELLHDGGPAEEARQTWQKLGELEREAAASFPLSAEGCKDLLADLKPRVQSLYEGEAAALKDLHKLVNGGGRT